MWRVWARDGAEGFIGLEPILACFSCTESFFFRKLDFSVGLLVFCGFPDISIEFFR